MELVPYSDEDIGLVEELECDPEAMSELGGPVAPERIPEIHARRLATVAAGDWYFKISPDGGGPDAGTIGICSAEWRGEPIYEAGWMVLPAFQGQGIASRALAKIISMAKADGRFRRIYAFPSVTNAPSNALCRKFGFKLIEETDFDYRGAPLRVNVWELAVGDPGLEPGTSSLSETRSNQLS
jgi:RimJ/RimL family protein N-acetyltransferase